MPTAMFYASLPPMSRSLLYVNGYTEALEVSNMAESVKIVPNQSFIEDLSTKAKDNFYSVGFPCYFIPIKQGHDYYGYILKSAKKKRTAHESNWLTVFNLEALYYDNKYLFGVEGIKDAYLFLKNKIPVCAAVTSTFSDLFLDEIKKQNKCFCFVPDNDETGHEQKLRMLKRCYAKGINVMVYSINGHKDFGDYFVPSLQHQVWLSFKDCVSKTLFYFMEKK